MAEENIVIESLQKDSQNRIKLEEFEIYVKNRLKNFTIPHHGKVEDL